MTFPSWSCQHCLPILASLFPRSAFVSIVDFEDRRFDPIKPSIICTLFIVSSNQAIQNLAIRILFYY